MKGNADPISIVAGLAIFHPLPLFDPLGKLFLRWGMAYSSLLSPLFICAEQVIFVNFASHHTGVGKKLSEFILVISVIGSRLFYHPHGAQPVLLPLEAAFN